MKVNILGFTYQIIFTPNIELFTQDNEKYDGYFDNDSQIIYIDSTLHFDAQFSTLIHEVLEILVSKLNIPIDHDNLERLEVGLFETCISDFNIFNYPKFVYNVKQELKINQKEKK